MHILLLGAGLQGRAALYDLIRSPDVAQVTVADADAARARQSVPELAHPKVDFRQLDAQDLEAVRALMLPAGAVIHLLPARFRLGMARLAVDCGTHFVDASYADPGYADLDRPAAARGLAILPEFGLDPGIDLVLAGQAIRDFDTVHELHSYGAGIPEPAAAQNALRYKISWSFEGVLNAYTRPARRVRAGQAEEVPAAMLFDPSNVHEVHVEGLGILEAYPNGDAVKYVEMLGLAGSVREAGRYSMRWPGHSALWRDLISLGLLGDAPVQVGSAAVVPRRFLHELLLPQLQYGPDERDIALIRVEAAGLHDGLPKRVVYELIDRRDLDSGLLAMQRTVGFTAAIGARMLVRGDIAKRGLLSPAQDVPAGMLITELEARGIRVRKDSGG